MRWVCRSTLFSADAEHPNNHRKRMNTIDLIVCLVLAAAVWNGCRQGFIMQLGSLAALLAGLWLAARYADAAGAWLRLDGEVRCAGGFAAVFVATLLAAGIVARLLRKIFHWVGFGLPDRLLGAAVSVVKYLLLLSVLFALFDRLNAGGSLIKAQTLETSRTYRPVMRLSKELEPFIERIGGGEWGGTNTDGKQ